MKNIGVLICRSVCFCFVIYKKKQVFLVFSLSLKWKMEKSAIRKWGGTPFGKCLSSLHFFWTTSLTMMGFQMLLNDNLKCFQKFSRCFQDVLRCSQCALRCTQMFYRRSQMCYPLPKLLWTDNFPQNQCVLT